MEIIFYKKNRLFNFSGLWRRNITTNLWDGFCFTFGSRRLDCEDCRIGKRSNKIFQLRKNDTLVCVCPKYIISNAQEVVISTFNYQQELIRRK